MSHDTGHQFVLPTADGQFVPCPALMTEAELVRFLRLDQVSKARDPHHVIEHLKRMRGLPRVHLCNKALYPLRGILKWLEEQTVHGS